MTYRAFFSRSSGPCDVPGWDLRYIVLNEDYKPDGLNGKHFTPSFGWWRTKDSYFNGDKACYRSENRQILESKGIVIYDAYEEAIKGFTDENSSTGL